MNNKKINSTEDYYEGWDDEFLWQRIEFAMNKKRKKKYFIYFVILGGICVLSSLLFLKSNDNVNINYITNIENSKNSKNEILVDCNLGNEMQSGFSRSLRISQTNDQSKQTERDSKSLSTINDKAVGTTEKVSQISRIDLVESKGKIINLYQELNTMNSNNEFSEIEKIPVTLSLIPSPKMNKINFEENLFLIDKLFDESCIKKSVFHNHPLFIQYSVEIGLGHRKDKFNDQVEAQNLKHKNEKYVYSLSQSLEFLKSIHSNVQVGMGINYLSHISNLKGNNIEVKQKLVPSDSAIFQNIGGINYYYSGYVLNTSTTKQSFDVYNSYSSLSVPFSIYFYKSLNKNQLFFSLGSALKLVNLKKGYSYNDLGKIEEFESNNRKLNLELQYLSTSLGYRYEVYPRCYLSIAVENYLPITYNKVQMYKSGQSFSSKYSYTGLELGVIYHLK